MAVDLKIELFAIDLFRNLWFQGQLLNFIPPRIKEGNEKSENSYEAVHAVWCRHQIFQQTLYNRIWNNYCLFSSSGVDFYLYIHNNVLETIPYQLNVFDKLLMTCAFVLEMACCCSFNSDQCYLYFAPLSWAMFFDSEFKSEFYFEGGWEILKKYTSSYSSNILTLSWMKPNSLPDLTDYVNMKLLYQSTNKFYNISKLVKKFSKRYKNRRDKSNVACQRCLPLLLVFKSIVLADENEDDHTTLVEGYLQIILRMLSTEEYGRRRKEFLATLHNDDSSDSDESDVESSENRQSTNSSSEESSTSTEDELKMDNPADIIEGAFRILTTSELVRRLFVDETSSKMECICGFELCIFCGRAIDTTAYPAKEKFSVHVERIKSAIEKVVNKETRKKVTQINMSGVKDVLRLFPSLGLEPMKSHMLALTEAEQKDIAKVDIDDASEALSSLNLNDSPTKGAKSKRKKKKSVKK